MAPRCSGGPPRPGEEYPVIAARSNLTAPKIATSANAPPIAQESPGHIPLRANPAAVRAAAKHNAPTPATAARKRWRNVRRCRIIAVTRLRRFERFRLGAIRALETERGQQRAGEST